MTEKIEPKFARDCRACEESTGVGFSYWDKADDRSVEVAEDDGALIVRKNGVRAVFHIGQDELLSVQKDRIEKVLNFLGLSKHIEKNVPTQREIDEQDEDENGDYECPHCGRRHN